MKKHKHSELIKLWADGAQIEYLADEVRNVWRDTDEPAWSDLIEYRIKLERKRYRVAKFKDRVYIAVNYFQASEFEHMPEFIEWLTDWIEYD